MRGLSILLSFAIAFLGGPVFAETPTSASPSPAAAIEEADPSEEPASAPVDDATRPDSLEARIAELEARRAAISTRGPRAATITGTAMMGGGLGIAAVAGILCAAASSGSSTQCRVDNAIGIAAGGGVIAIAGLVTWLTGRKKLRERNAARETLGREIETLERQRKTSAMPGLGFAVGSNQAPGLVLGWQF